jgi:hypothetical protein
MSLEKSIMSISITITDSIANIEKNINKGIADYINDILNKKQNLILQEAKALIPDWVNSQPEIISLASSNTSSLVGLFGIAGDTTSIINSIVKSVVDATTITFVKYTDKLKGAGLQLEFQPSNFSNLLLLNAGHTIYDGGDLHWLDWLLKRGDKVIITNYHYNPSTGLGRSGLGNMIQGGSFRVPPQFAGTDDNNFITRAFNGPTQEKQLTSIFEKVFK